MPKKTSLPFQINTRQLKKGCTIFQIGGGHRGGGTGIWQYRINIEGGKNKRRSAFTVNEAAAEDVALAAYYEVRKNIADGVPNIQVLMNRVIKEWLADEKDRIGRKIEGIKPDTYRNYQICGGKYLTEFFGKMPIQSIDEDTIKNYWKWRQVYYHDPKNVAKTKAVHIAKNPKAGTLMVDYNSMNRLFRFAVSKKYIHRRETPEFTRPKDTKTFSSDENPRTAYSIAEMETLYAALDKEVDSTSIRKHKLARNRIRQMVHIMEGAGLRAVEARHLRWKDVTTYNHPDGDSFLRIWAQGKTPPRAVMASMDLMEHFDVMKMINWRHCSEDDLVFADQKGKWSIHGYSTFTRIAKAAGVFYDKSGLTEEGVSRPLTSMRHTYITNALSTGSIPIDMLAANCGNSVAEIERTYRHVANEMNAPTLVKNGSADYRVKKAIQAGLDNPIVDEDLVESTKAPKKT